MNLCQHKTDNISDANTLMDFGTSTEELDVLNLWLIACVYDRLYTLITSILRIFPQQISLPECQLCLAISANSLKEVLYYTI